MKGDLLIWDEKLNCGEWLEVQEIELVEGGPNLGGPAVQRSGLLPTAPWWYSRRAARRRIC